MRSFTSRSAIVLVAALFSVAGCKSMGDNIPVGIAAPEIQVFQLNSIGNFIRQYTGAASVNLRIDLQNVAPEEITLYQIRMESMGGGGGFRLPEFERPFNVAIPSNALKSVQLWAPAEVTETISGPNGPVTIRTIAYFHSRLGSFQKIYVSELNDGMGGQPDRSN